MPMRTWSRSSPRIFAGLGLVRLRLRTSPDVLVGRNRGDLTQAKG